MSVLFAAVDIDGPSRGGMQRTMDVGRVSRFNHAERNKRSIYNPGHKQRLGNTEDTDDETNNCKHSSPHQMPRLVKSLMSGSVLYPESAVGNSNRSKQSIRNRSPANKGISERVVIDKKIRQNSKQIRKVPKSEATSPTSHSSFFASIGACVSAGAGAASFLNERSEETRFEYHFDDANCNTDGKNCHERRIYNCYGSSGGCNTNGGEKDVDEMMVRFSNTSIPLTKSRTCATMESTKDSLVILNSRDNTVRGISGGGGVELNHASTTHDAFANARRLLFGKEGTSIEENAEKQLSSYRCNSRSNVLCNSTNKGNFCLSPSDKEAFDGANDNDNNNTSFIRWYSQESPVSPNYDRSFDRSSFSPSKTIYTAAYGDDDAGGTTEYPFGGDVMSPHSSSILRNEDDRSHCVIQYWRQRLHYARKYNGNAHSSTADAYFNLGRAQMNLSPNNSGHNREAYIDPYGLPMRRPREAAPQQKHRYDLAIENLTIAHGIWERRHGPEHLAVGRALDSLALAIVKRANHDRATRGSSSTAIKEDLRYARRLLEQAFSVRVQHLGVWHVDTVETYNKLAGVLLHLGLLGEACRAYREVFLVRRAIFGNQHPSVAISAHALANGHYKRGNIKESLRWYNASLEVYEAMGLSYRHPAVAQLLRHQSRLEEYMDLEV